MNARDRYLQKAGAYPDIPELSALNIPVNSALAGLAAGLAAGHLAYNVPSLVLASHF